MLTASGGPFRGRTRDELDDVTPEEALAHPTWSHGAEDHDRLGDAREQGPRGDRGALPLRRRRTTGSRSSSTRRRSCTALVRFRDGAAIAHLGYPDMRVPISYALTYPDARRRPVPPLELHGTLEFHEPDTETFPMLALAREAGERGGTYPCVYNAANEVAVAAFLEGRIRLPRASPPLVRTSLGASTARPRATSTSCVEADRSARRDAGAGAREWR